MGEQLGVTQLVPDEESYNIGEKRLHSQLAFIMGGRAAEKLVFDEFSRGGGRLAQGDPDAPERMIGHWGMSEKIGPSRSDRERNIRYWEKKSIMPGNTAMNHAHESIRKFNGF